MGIEMKNIEDYKPWKISYNVLPILSFCHEMLI